MYETKLDKKKFRKYRKLVEKDEMFIDMCEGKGIQPSTIRKYSLSLAAFCYFTEMTPTELYEEADAEEEDGVRINRRKLRSKLIKFNKFQVDKGFSSHTITTRLMDVKQFYIFHGIEIPKLPRVKNKKSYTLEFKDLPTKQHIKTAIQGTSRLHHIAVLLFAFSSGTARTELSNVTVRDFIDGTKDYHNGTKDFQDVLEQLDGRNDVIPIIRMFRVKTERHYYTCCSPEAVQAIVDLHKAKGTTDLDEKLFLMNPQAISRMYINMNDKYNWGWVGNYRLFTSHKLRKLHASLIEDITLANALQGRSNGVITDTYFINKPERLRERYLEHINKLTINEVYTITITDANYDRLLEVIAEKDKEIEDIKKTNAQINERLDMIDSIRRKIDNLDKEEYGSTYVRDLIK